MKAYSPVLEKYSRQAPRYDRRWNRFYGQALLRATVEAVPWKGLERVLDVGCGTGVLEETVLPRLPSPICLVGVDASLAMLQQACGKWNGANHAHPRWSNALAENLPFPNGSFDAVVCANSFHYYRWPLRVLEEFRRVLHPGGWLILADWCDDYLVCKICHWALRLMDQAHFFRYGIQQCYSMEECEQLLTQAGFQIESARRFKIDLLWGLMTFQAKA